MIAVALGPGFQGSKIGTGTGLGITLAPPVLTAQDPWEVVVLLSPGAELDDHRRHHVHTERNQSGRSGGGALLVKDVFLHHGPTGTAVLHRPVNGIPALLVKYLLPALMILFGQSTAQTDLLGKVGRQILFQKRPHLSAESQLFGGEMNIHNRS